MKEHFAVVGGSGVTRDRILVPPQAIIDAYFSVSNIGTPSAISHDIHRLCGWARSSSLYLDRSGVKQTALIQIAETEEELTQFRNRLGFVMRERIREHGKEKEELDKLLARYNISEKIKYISLNSISAYHKDIVSKIDPAFFADADDHGLVDYSKLEEVVPGVYILNKDFVVYAHRYFRRSLSLHNSLNTHFFRTLKNAYQGNKANASFRILIDPDIVGYNMNVLHSIEFEYWYGPKFDDDLTGIANGVSTYKADELLKLFHGITLTQFQWKDQRESKVLEVEELIDNPSFGINDKTFGLRYVHSMVDIKTGLINHLDGAIRAYDEEEYLHRKEVSIDRTGKKHPYTKLWRLDGKIPLGMWKRLILDYYRDNTLVGEYFGVADSDGPSKNVLLEKPNTGLRERVVPYSCKTTKDIKISFRQIDGKRIERTRLHTLNEVRLPDGRGISYFEADTIHFLKALSSANVSFSTPEGVDFLICEDLYHNMPIVETTIEEFPKIVGVYMKCLNGYVAKGMNAILSINFVVYGPNSFVLGLYGKAEMLQKLFDSALLYDKNKDLKNWLLELRKCQTINERIT